MDHAEEIIEEVKLEDSEHIDRSGDLDVSLITIKKYIKFNSTLNRFKFVNFEKKITFFQIKYGKCEKNN